MRFTKMHGLGNDYVYVDAVTDPSLESVDWPQHTPAMSDRHTGIGGDGVILICPPRDDRNHARMRTFNADGSESGACGNGTRCVARYVHERLGVHVPMLRIESGSRVLECEPLGDGTVRVAMGEPGLALNDCDITSGSLASQQPPAIDVDGRRLRFTAVSMGNPHAVAFASENPWLGEDLAAAALRFGPLVERHPAFASRTNAHFVRIESPTRATVHTWERGAGPTRACGTGACATLVAAVLAGRLTPSATLALPGGDLDVSWQPAGQGGDNIVRQAGPAAFVFDGAWIASREGMLV
jgi:diaminopimelate epimerase